MELFSEKHGPTHVAPPAGEIPLGVKQSLADSSDRRNADDGWRVCWATWRWLAGTP